MGAIEILNPYRHHFGLKNDLPTMNFHYLCFFILLVDAVFGVPDPDPKPKPKTQRGFYFPGRGNFGHQDWFLRNRNYRRSPWGPFFPGEPLVPDTAFSLPDKPFLPDGPFLPDTPWDRLTNPSPYGAWYGPPIG